MIMCSKKFKCWIIICCRIINYKHIFKRFHGHVNIDINCVAYCNAFILISFIDSKSAFLGTKMTFLGESHYDADHGISTNGSGRKI